MSQELPGLSFEAAVLAANALNEVASALEKKATIASEVGKKDDRNATYFFAMANQELADAPKLRELAKTIMCLAHS